MKLWEIAKLATEEKLKEGDKFRALDLSITLIIEFDGCSLVYNKIFHDSTSRDTVVLCSGELSADFVRI